MVRLSDPQRSLLDSWLGEWHVVADHTWPLQDTTVLKLRDGHARDYIAKASLTSHHIEREIDAHQRFLRRFAGRVPTFAHASSADGILVTEYLPGDVVEGTPAEWTPETYRQAGALLADLLVPGVESEDYVVHILARATEAIERADGLVPPDQLAELTLLVATIPVRALPLFFTHGDYQPRNWLLHEGELRVIDFGRAEQRPWTSELVRLQNQQFLGRPDLEAAFSAGLDRLLTSDDPDALTLERIHQAVGTVVWAHGIGDTAFEDHGRRMIQRIIDVG